MPAIPFSAGTTITGVGGKLYIFPISTLNIYKIEAVVIFRDTSTETWESVAKGSFSAIWVLLSAVTLDEDFYHFISGNIVYVFVEWLKAQVHEKGAIIGVWNMTEFHTRANNGYLG